MGQCHWVDISGGHAAYVSTSCINDKRGGTNGVDSTVRRLLPQLLASISKEGGACHCIGTGGDITGTRGRGNKVVCGIHCHEAAGDMNGVVCGMHTAPSQSYLPLLT